jgi:hypothetical protein
MPVAGSYRRPLVCGRSWEDEMRTPPIIVIAALAALTFTALACGGDDGGDIATATPVVTRPPEGPTPTAETLSAINFRNFAGEVQNGINSEGLDYITGRMDTEPVVCEAEDVGAGPGGPVCEFEGQEFDGFEVAFWQSEGAIVPEDDAVATFAEFFTGIRPDVEDDFGSGTPQVYALNIQDDPAGEQAFDIIITAMIERPENFAGEGPLRVAVATSWGFVNGEWLVYRMLFAAVSSEDFLLPSEFVAEEIFPDWERFEG